MLSNIPINLMKILDTKPSKEMMISFNDLKVSYLNHHECHAASAFFTSPFKNCDILTIDSHGEQDTCFLGTGKNNDIKEIKFYQYPHSLNGLFYGTFTDFLGFKPDSDEWKVMALASYALKKNIYDKKIEKLFKLTKKGF